MAKKRKKDNKETTIENYYDLRQEAVDDLVEALRTGEGKEDISTNIAEITGESSDAKPGSKKAEFDPYKRDKLAGIPTWLKAIFIKWWFAGCVCYFIIMGLGEYLVGYDLPIVLALVYGVVIDIFVNPVFRFMESDRKEYNNYMMFPFPFKAFWTFFANIAYSFCVIFIVYIFYNLINTALDSLGASYGFWLEPLTFGTITVAIDMAFIGIKDGIVYGVKKAKRKKAEAAELEAELSQQPIPEELVVQEKSAEAKALDEITSEVLGGDKDIDTKK